VTIREYISRGLRRIKRDFEDEKPQTSLAPLVEPQPSLAPAVPLPEPQPSLAPLEQMPTPAAVQRFRKFKPFDPERYLRRNPDVAAANADPYQHALEWGCFEGRIVFEPLPLAQSIGHAAKLVGAEEDRAPEPERRPTVGIVCSSRGNVFMSNIANQLQEGLSRAGALVTQLNEMGDPEEKFDHRLIVAPHEFFYGKREDKWLSKAVIGSSFLLLTEQIQTSWFRDSVPYLFEAKGVIDMYSHSAALISETGISTHHFVPDPPCGTFEFGNGYRSHPLFQGLPEAARLHPNYETSFYDRPIDVSFFGVESPHRDLTLALCAPVLSQYNTFIYYRRLSRGPLVGADSVLVDLASHVAAQSKITLNLHRDYYGAFEWFRIVQIGMCAGSVVLSERSLPVGDFKAGEHFIEVDGRHIGEMVEWLLAEKDGQDFAARVRANAIKRLQSAYQSNQAAVCLLGFLELHQ
jgi:hypothetical protein